MSATRDLALVLSSAAVTFMLAQLLNLQVLVEEVKVEAGEKYAMPEDAESGSWNRTVLVCRYFAWTRMRSDVVDYSTTGATGYAACPRFVREQRVRW